MWEVSSLPSAKLKGVIKAMCVLACRTGLGFDDEHHAGGGMMFLICHPGRHNVWDI